MAKRQGMDNRDILKMETHEKIYQFHTYTENDVDINAANLWRGFQQHTTAHGLPCISNSIGQVKKCFWTTVTLGMVAFFLYIFYIQTDKFFKYSVDVKIQMVQKREIDFPAVTICNTNPIKQSALESNPELNSILSKKRRIKRTIGSGENVAAGKTAWQSSTLHNGTADKAVDGNHSATYNNNGSCIHTAFLPNPWLIVDLGFNHMVSAVGLVNRAGCCPERLSNFEVRVGDSPTNLSANALCLVYPGIVPTDPVLNELQCDNPLKGRYVSIQMFRDDALTLCEFEAYAYNGYDIRDCSVDSSTYHAESGMCFGLYDSTLRPRTGSTGMNQICRAIDTRAVTLQTESKYNFVRNSTELFYGLDLVR